ncbi:uncharacterized protein ATC70_001824 [Mucor velutinosus]|uniref:Uncharacterized protein n=1 Tax=Mucor velutinosus TaxID=708070 RepID=A0AAN7HSK7_9FUNG|nr:hypothetical protein ATC70_001824 [Mucor velutinosus]
MVEHDTAIAENSTQIKNEKDGQLDIQHVESSNLDYDAQRLHDLGYKQEFKREISLLVQTGFSMATMGVLPNWMVGFGGSMVAGGPSSLFWGWIVVVPFVLCIAFSMAEVISAYPLAGGVYSWSFLLSNKKWSPFMAWITGYVYCIGLVTANITLAWSSVDFIYGIANVLNVAQITSKGAYVGLYCGIFVFATCCNWFGMKFSSIMNKFIVFWTLIGTLIIVCCVPAMAPTHRSAKWVFLEFLNKTGYDNKGMAFLLGLLQSGWTLDKYSRNLHGGTKRADVTAPRGIIICILSAVVQGFALILITLFSIQDVEAIIESSMPIATFFTQTTNDKLCVFFLVIMLVAQLSSLCNSMLATVHIFWALSRDGCFPYSKVWYKLNPKTNVPTNALILQLAISIILIMPSFGSEVYWQAIMSAAVISINVSYGLPLLCRLIWVRRDMPKGPFSLGKLSIPLNIISCIWVGFFGVILCIPSVSPVTPETMNWASVMICGIMGFSVIFWFVSGRKSYKGPIETADE